VSGSDIGEVVPQKGDKSLFREEKVRFPSGIVGIGVGIAMARSASRLTAIQVSRIKKKGRYADGGGLYLGNRPGELRQCDPVSTTLSGRIADHHRSKSHPSWQALKIRVGM
jgi:hypothetical protein